MTNYKYTLYELRQTAWDMQGTSNNAFIIIAILSSFVWFIFFIISDTYIKQISYDLEPMRFIYANLFTVFIISSIADSLFFIETYKNRPFFYAPKEKPFFIVYVMLLPFLANIMIVGISGGVSYSLFYWLIDNKLPWLSLILSAIIFFILFFTKWINMCGIYHLKLND